jgi:CBS domain-containing protein
MEKNMISLRVKDALITPMLALIVDAKTPVEDVIKSFAEKPEIHGIFVVDEKMKLKGVITRYDLLLWAKVMTGVPRAKNIDDLMNTVRISMSKTAGGMVRPETKDATVTLDDDINVALDKMIRLELLDIPVVDKKGKVIDDLRLSEILKAIIEKTKKR